MATLIPALGACVSRMTAGERRLAERLEHKLDADYLLWYDVPVGPRNTHPDTLTIKVNTMHASKGLEFFLRDEKGRFGVEFPCASCRTVPH